MSCTYCGMVHFEGPCPDHAMKQLVLELRAELAEAHRMREETLAEAMRQGSALRAEVEALRQWHIERGQIIDVGIRREMSLRAELADTQSKLIRSTAEANRMSAEVEELQIANKKLRSALRPFASYAARNGAITLLGTNGGRITSEAWDNAEKALTALSGGEEG